MKKELREITDAANDQGWRWEELKSGHVRFYPPDKRFPAVVFSGTPGDHRSFKNAMANMKRAGFKWPWSGGKTK